MSRFPLGAVVFSPYLAEFSPFLAEISPCLAEFSPCLAEFFLVWRNFRLTWRNVCLSIWRRLAQFLSGLVSFSPGLVPPVGFLLFYLAWWAFDWTNGLTPSVALAQKRAARQPAFTKHPNRSIISHFYPRRRFFGGFGVEFQPIWRNVRRIWG